MLNIANEISKFTGKLTDQVSSKAKDSAISTLKDPEFKATVNKFTKDWINEHKFELGSVFLICFILSILAIVNIITSFRKR